MKKTLVAVAALAAFAGAHAEVAITGLIEAGILVPNTGANSMASGGNGGSEITFTATDDLGSGLKATGSVTIINNPFADSSSGAPAAAYAKADGASNVMRTYNSFVGVSGDFGSLKLGNQPSPAFNAANIADPFGQAGGTFNLAKAGGFISNTVNYASPSFSGATVAYQVTADNSQSGYSLSYSAGAFNAAIAAETVDSTSTTTTVVAASYDMGVAKLSAGSTTATGGTIKPATILGVSAPVGPVVLVYSASAQSTKSNNQNMGLVYPMSKKTNLTFVNYNGGSSATRGNFIGIRTTF